MKIGVVGLGLIGGSLAKVLNSKGYEITGVSRSPETIDKAVKSGFVKTGSIDLRDLKDCEIVFVCTPINATIFTINELTKILPASSIITDAASIKGPVIDFINTNHDPVNFIGGHPMAGTEEKGIDASFDTLFEGAKWVLTPSKWTKEEDLEKLAGVINDTGAETIIADAQEHDKAVSLISHMPVLVSQALMKLVKDYPDQDISELALKLAASGFRDMTRISATNPELSNDMLFENRTNVLNSIRELSNIISNLEREMVENEENFSGISQDIANFRKKLYSPEGKNIYKH